MIGIILSAFHQVRNADIKDVVRRRAYSRAVIDKSGRAISFDRKSPEVISATRAFATSDDGTVVTREPPDPAIFQKAVWLSRPDA